MAAKPTIADVAARAGVSKAAASFALNDRPGVSTATRERILQVAKELGFTPNSAARALSTRRSDNLGLVLARSHDTLGSDPFFPSFIAGVESALDGTELCLLVRMVGDENSEHRAYQDMARTGRVDGVFLTDLRVDDPRPALLTRLGIPAVTLNRAQEPAGATAVCVDDGQAVLDAVRHLVGLGHRTIGHIAGPAAYLHAAHRRQRWAAALTESGVVGPVVEADFSAGGGAAATLQMLDAPDPPTAILYANDLMAVAGIAAARQRGLVVPHDLSVIGFDDSQLAAFLSAPLTTVRTDVHGWGRAAATALQARVLGQQIDDIDLPAAELVIRSSTGPPPDRGPPRPAGRRESSQRRSHPAPVPRRNATPTVPRRPEKERP